MTDQPGSDDSYVERLGEVLRTRQAAALRAFLADNAQRFGNATEAAAINAQSDEEISALMHRMTLARADLRQFHAESRQWLTQRGMRGPTGDPERRN